MINLTFQDTVLQIRTICDKLCNLTSHNNNYQTLLKFDTHKTYELSEFCELQIKQCKKVKEVLIEYRKEILQLLIKACQVKMYILFLRFGKDFVRFSNLCGHCCVGVSFFVITTLTHSYTLKNFKATLFPGDSNKKKLFRG